MQRFARAGSRPRSAARRTGSTPATPSRCARDLMESVPLVMRFIRTEMRRRGARFASVPQLRTLGFVDRNSGASLSGVAMHLGVTPATASAIVERLVRQGLLNRDSHPRERRRLTLSLTPAGTRHLSEARVATRRRLEQALACLPTRDLATISAGALLLRQIFRDEGSPDGR